MSRGLILNSSLNNLILSKCDVDTYSGQFIHRFALALKIQIENKALKGELGNEYFVR